MAELSKGVKIAAIFAAVGIAAGIGISLLVTRSPDIQQRVAEDGDGFDDLSLAEKNKIFSYLSVGINYKNTFAVGEEGDFTGAAKGGAPPYKYEWTFSDGAAYNTVNVTRSFDSPGMYNGRLTVTDSAGTQRYSSFTIEVVNSTGTASQ